jgi:hypothetical protein
MRIKMGKDELLRINRGTKFDNVVGELPRSSATSSPYEMGKLLQFLFRKYEGKLWTHLRNSSLPLLMFQSNMGSSFDIRIFFPGEIK